MEESVLTKRESTPKGAPDSKREAFTTKVVFVSGTPDYAIDAWQYHVNDYLITPITLEGIQHTLKSCFSDSDM